MRRVGTPRVVGQNREAVQRDDPRHVRVSVRDPPVATTRPGIVAELVEVRTEEIFAADKLRVVLVLRVPAIAERECGAAARGIYGSMDAVRRAALVDARPEPAQVVARPLRPVEEVVRLRRRLADVLVGRPPAELLQLLGVLRVNEDHVRRPTMPRRPLHHKRRVRVDLDRRVRKLRTGSARADRARPITRAARDPAQPVVCRRIRSQDAECGRHATTPPAAASARHARNESDAHRERA